MDNLLESLRALNGLVLWGGVVWVVLISVLALGLLFLKPIKKSFSKAPKEIELKTLEKNKPKGF